MTTHKNRVAACAGGSAVLMAGGALYASASWTGTPGLSAGGVLSLAEQAISFDHTAFWAFFAALFAIMNPLIAVPMFVRMTRRHNSAQRRKLATVCSATVLFVLLASALFGEQLLAFFAIDISSFRIAGGMIVLLMGLAMMSSKTGDDVAADAGDGTVAEDERSQAICPMAIPLLAGPGAIATLILQSQTAAMPADYGMIACVISAIVVLTYLTLRLAVPIARLLGPTGLMVATRLIGMIVAAIAMDMVVAGLHVAFPGIP